MKTASRYIAPLVLILAIAFSEIHAQEMPPAHVVVSEVRSGMIAPQVEFIGTVYYQEMSDVASEVNGAVEEVTFEEGDRVVMGESLVKLNSDLLGKTLQATQASYEQVLAELESATRDLERAEKLHEEELISDKTYDDFMFRKQGVEKKAASLRADVERLNLELRKKEVPAPYDGVVVRKHVNRGEWISPGDPVATVAKDDTVDVIVEIPEEILAYLKVGMSVPVMTGGSKINGRIFAIVPSGEVTTRTFPVKIRTANTRALKQGMEARVSLPSGKRAKTLIVPRDAVLTKSGITFLFAVIDAHARMIPVKIIGYSGLNAGIEADGLIEGMSVVVKGNERLMNGQPVAVSGGGEKAG
jgi:RND family efflux transporter MFP subunit